MTKAEKQSGNPGVDRIELMQTFVRIVEAGSLSAAAEQLKTSQPTVSRRLQTLERALGLRLLQRSTHVMKLTEDGERCFAHAKDLLDNWKAMEADLRGTQDEPEGTLRVLVPHAFGQDQLIVPLTNYLGRFPRVSVEWLLHDRRPDFIAEGIDCAIQVGAVDNPSVIAIKLFDIPRIVVAAPQHVAGKSLPLKVEDLHNIPWLALRTFYRDEVTLTQQSNGEEHRFAIRPRMSTDSLYALRNAALAGLGAGIVSAWIVADDIAQGRLLHLAPDWRAAPLPVYLVYPYARYYPARLRLFVETIRSMMPLIEEKTFAVLTRKKKR
ncbi:LysR family transcriptional regulator [Herminiimonas fonticola]|uniref:LysR family transcriptional regulator n=1 Tax=Herminiimonas fonticola TaxID=303380 RepID=A0A4R6G4W9_9BURK|nr:LysR family transcriptional regulator [Herminiimonas fonticola]RBA23091.1 Transcriptional regulator [Herminiimonas fonticola]TDN89467.1 LysR family transcriptional regulator [Herminiimonas fonticola]